MPHKFEEKGALRPKRFKELLRPNTSDWQSSYYRFFHPTDEFDNKIEPSDPDSDSIGGKGTI